MSTVRIGDIARIRRGASPRPIADPMWFSDAGPGWVRIGDATRGGKYLRSTEQKLSAEGAARSVRVKAGDLIMSVAASVGITAIVDMDACIHDGWVVLTEFSEYADREFLYYLLSHHAPSIAAVGQTGSQNNINSDILRDWTVDLPALPVQRRVSALLSTVDRILDVLNSLRESKDALKRALLHDLLTGRQRFPEFGAPGDGHTSPPADWCVRTLGDVADVRVSGIDKHTRAEEPAVRLCNYMDVWTRPYITDALPFMQATASPAEIERFALRPGDVLLTKDSETREDIAQTSAVLDAGADVVLGYHTALARPTDAGTDGRFLAAQLRHPRFRQHFVRAAQGATRFGLTYDALVSAPVWLPCHAEQRRIADLDRMLHDEIMLIECNREAYATLKRALMHRLLSGDLPLPAPAAAPEVAYA